MPNQERENRTTLERVVALRSPDLDAQTLARSVRAPDVLEELATKLPAWHREAACRDADPDLFFVGRGESAAEAKAICAGCPVRPECLEDAIAHDYRFGIFGGMNRNERRKAARRGLTS